MSTETEKPSPISAEEAETLVIDSSDWNISRRIQHPGTSKEALLILAKKDLFYSIRSAIAQAPNTDEEILEILTSYPTQRWEWRAIYTQMRSLYNSFLKNYEANEPLCSDMINGKFSSPSLASAYLLHAGGMLAEDLWHDLAERKLLDLGYQNDTYDGDQFGPIYDPKINLYGSAQYLLSPGYFCEWIEKVPDVDTDYVFESILDAAAEDYFEQEDYKEEEDLTESYMGALVAGAYGFTNGHLEMKDPEAYSKFFSEMVEGYDIEMLDMDVKLSGEPAVVGKRFRDLSESEIDNVIANLIIANKHYICDKFGITGHFFALLLIHPNTTDTQKELILENFDKEYNSNLMSYLESLK